MPSSCAVSASARISRGRVDGAALGGLRDRDGAGLRAVLVADAVTTARLTSSGVSLPSGVATATQLGAEQPLGSAALVDGDVGALGQITCCHGCRASAEADEVRAGAVEDEGDLGAPAEMRPDAAIARSVTASAAVGGRVPLVGGGDRREHLGVHAAVVVAAEAVHHRTLASGARRHAGWAATAARAPPAIRRPAPSMPRPGPPRRRAARPPRFRPPRPPCTPSRARPAPRTAATAAPGRRSGCPR